MNASRFGISLLLLALLWAPLATLSGSPPPVAEAATNCDVADLELDAEELAFLTALNTYRAQSGAPPVKMSRTLNRAASWFALDMATKNYFPQNHVDSLGRDPFVRMDQCDVAPAPAGRAENIAAGNDTAAATMLQWQNSAGHDANMKNPVFRSIGIARYFDGASTYGWYWVTDFSAEIVSTAVSNFSGDLRSDAGIFRPSVVPDALWYSIATASGTPFQIYFGAAGDIPVPGDYDGDGRTDAVIWRPTTGLWYGPRTGAATIVTQFILGQNGDIPVPCDYNGDGKVDPAIYRPSTGLWYGTTADGSTVVLNTNLGVVAGDIPAPADFNGDGKCDPAIMRPGSGPGGTNLWYSVPSGGGAAFQIYFGAPGDIPAPADYDADGKADAVIFRPTTGLWYGPRTGAATIVTQIFLGQNADIPMPGDFDANGTADPTIYRPSTGLFYGTNPAGNTVVVNTNFGAAAGDIPTGQRPHYQAAYPYSAPPSNATSAMLTVTPVDTSRSTPTPATVTATPSAQRLR